MIFSLGTTGKNKHKVLTANCTNYMGTKSGNLKEVCPPWKFLAVPCEELAIVMALCTVDDVHNVGICDGSDLSLLRVPVSKRLN